MAKEQDPAQHEPSAPTGGESAASPTPDNVSAKPGVSDSAGVATQEQLHAMEQKVRRTGISFTWATVIVAIVLLVLMLIFILQNLNDVTVTFFGASGQLPLGVMLLFAAIGGAVLVAIVGVARLGQLRLNARQRRRASKRPRTGPTRPGKVT
jgi:uncharacterized integral membrane protein